MHDVTNSMEFNRQTTVCQRVYIIFDYFNAEAENLSFGFCLCAATAVFEYIERT